MSTVMYCFKVKKSDLWNLFDQMKDFYRQNSIGYALANAYNTACRSEKINFWSAIEELRELEPEYLVKVQLFDMAFCGQQEYYLFRVLEAGYLFINYHDQFDLIDPVFYDNRADVPPEHEQNRKIAEWLDPEIDMGRYLILPIVDYQKIEMFLYMLAIEVYS